MSWKGKLLMLCRGWRPFFSRDTDFLEENSTWDKKKHWSRHDYVRFISMGADPWFVSTICERVGIGESVNPSNLNYSSNSYTCVYGAFGVIRQLYDIQSMINGHMIFLSTVFHYEAYFDFIIIFSDISEIQLHFLFDNPVLQIGALHSLVLSKGSQRGRGWYEP